MSSKYSTGKIEIPTGTITDISFKCDHSTYSGNVTLKIYLFNTLITSSTVSVSNNCAKQSWSTGSVIGDKIEFAYSTSNSYFTIKELEVTYSK